MGASGGSGANRNDSSMDSGASRGNSHDHLPNKKENWEAINN